MPAHKKQQPRKPQTPFSPTKKRIAQEMRRDGSKLIDIADKLGVSTASVSRNLRKLGDLDDYHAKMPRSGRPRLLSSQKRVAIRDALLSGKFPDAAAAQRAMAPNVSPDTVRRACTQMGLVGRRRGRH
ncbi:hypothetical protein DL93DRAFT_2078333 [Clavulina sp. PMI_390]|nr:hypothetical protein DL93DRAFT_2078333 [Clavulina sp. PMI_390]